MTENQRLLAVLIDADNVQPSLIAEIMKAINQHGRPIDSRIYGDFSRDALKTWREIAPKYNIEIKHTYHASNGKNATDIALVIDAMDILRDGKVDGFCIVSSDSDFTHLARRIKRAGLFVLGIGRDNLILKETFDRFISLESLKPLPAPSEPPKPAHPVKVVTAKKPTKTVTKSKKPAAVNPLAGVDTPSVPAVSEFQMFQAAYKKAVETTKSADGWVHLPIIRDALVKLYPHHNPLIYKGVKHGQLKKVVQQMKMDYPGAIEMRSEKLTIYIRMKQP